MGGIGPRSTPTVYKDKVYAIGATGHAWCLSLKDGKPEWDRKLLEKEGAKLPNTEWGITSSPLIHEGNVIFNPGAVDGFGLVALDLLTGKTVWEGSGYKDFKSTHTVNRCGYSTPVIMELVGESQIVHYHGLGVSGINPASGKIFVDLQLRKWPGSKCGAAHKNWREQTLDLCKLWIR